MITALANLLLNIYESLDNVVDQIKSDAEAWQEELRRRALEWLEGATQVAVEVHGLVEGEAFSVVLHISREAQATDMRERIRKLSVALFVAYAHVSEESISVSVEADANSPLKRQAGETNDRVTISDSSAPPPSTDSAFSAKPSALFVAAASLAFFFRALF